MIVVFGSLNIDLVMRCSKLPAPGETVLSSSYQTFAGGKGGNQAVAASKFGADVKMVGSVGDDNFGKLLFSSLIESDVDTASVWFGDSDTGCASICVDQNGENIIIVAQGANAEANTSMIRPEWLNANTYLLLQMEIPLDENWKALRLAKSHNTKTIVTLAPFKKIPDAALADTDILITNQHESEELLKLADITAEEFARYHDLTLIITQGPQGAKVVTSNSTWQCAAPKTQVVDTVGAGDVFSGVLAAALDEGCELRQAVDYAVIAASLSCTKKGAQQSSPLRSELDTALNGDASTCG